MNGPAQVMGICNCTPDSFSDGDPARDDAGAIARGRQLFAEGCSVVDVGGESTRPGASDVSEAEELRRVLAVVAELARHGRVSIDTTKAAVARAAVAAGASIVNDVSGSLAELAGELRVGYVAMHRRGTPQTMADLTDYQDLVGEVEAAILDIGARARAAGATEVWVDPGLGFAKTFEQNRILLAHTDRLAESAAREGFGLCIGASRKGFLSEGLDGRHWSVEERAEQSLAAATWALSNGATMVRVHDGLATVRAAQLVAGRGGDR